MKQQAQEPSRIQAHTLSIDNCQKGTLTGVVKVISSNDSLLLLETGAGNLHIVGSDLKINKFDVGEGFLTFEGNISAFRYAAAKLPLLKRLFR